MSAKIAKHIFNTVVFNDLLPNEAVMQSIDLHWTGVANGGITYYNIEKKDMPDDEIEKSTLSINKVSGVFIVENEYPDFNVGDVYSPFDLLVKLRFKGDEKSAETYLIEHGYNDTSKYIESLIFNDRGKFNPYKASEFLKLDGYLRISEPGRDETVVYKVDNGIMNPINIKSDTLSVFTSKLKGHPEIENLANALVESRARVNNVWNLLEGEPYNLNRDTKDVVYIPFKNGVCKIDKSKYELIDYKSSELDFFIGVESQNHTFKEFDFKNRSIGQFERFIISAVIGKGFEDNLTPKEWHDVKAFFTMIGYLISNYKDPAHSPAIILSDEGADDVSRKGGRGKSLLTDAIKKVRKHNYRGGSEFDTGYRHVFGDLQKYHDFYIIDDAPASFNYDALYTNITGDITAERKGVDAITINFKDAPKFVITTNYAIRYDKNATSTNRRFLEYKFSNFWNDDNRPNNYFEGRFFDDWNKKEWQLFYEFFIYCVTLFLENGIIKISYSKESDNYFAYFSNSVVEDEMQRIMREMESRTEFKVSDFLKEHDKEESYRYKKLFNHINAKRRIDVWIEYHKLNWTYNTQWRKWEGVFEKENDENNPF